jgi:hypothetical protein
MAAARALVERCAPHNAEKSAVAYPWRSSFLGFTLTEESARHAVASPTRPVTRFKDRVRHLTGRNRGVSLERMITDLNRLCQLSSLFRAHYANSHTLLPEC